jgi:molybdopterin-containing oxidoreductase family membrane subunit
MWFERFVIIATTLARDYLPSSWSFYVPSIVEIGIYVGTIGIFFVFYLIFVRVAPVVAIAEIKHILKSSGDQYVNTNGQTTMQQIAQGGTALQAAGHGDSHGNAHH